MILIIMAMIWVLFTLSAPAYVWGFLIIGYALYVAVKGAGK